MSVYKRNRSLVVPFIAPALILYLLFFIYPAIRGLSYSTLEWSGFTQTPEFIGIQNFIELFKDQWFWTTLYRTLLIMVLGGIFIFGLSFLFVILLNSGIKGKSFFRTVIFVPNVIAPIALTTLWGFILNYRFGLVNGFLTAIGLEEFVQPWMGPNIVFWSMLVMIIWTYVGFYLVILLSAIAKIPSELYEVAHLEGARPLQMFIKITIPLIWDVLTIAIIYWGIFSLKMFEIIFSFTGFLPKNEIWTTPVYIYILGFGKINPIYRLGYATAISVVLLFIVLIFVIVSRFVFKRERIEY